MALSLLAATVILGLQSEPVTRTFEVDGLTRRATIYLPKASNAKSPILFAFHGHGGNMRSAARSFDFQSVWPEAIAVYMEGLPTKTPRDPQGTRNGWQMAGIASENRDLKFFDTVLASLVKESQGDSKRVFATGHSNGGGFTYTLWAERFDVLAGVAPSASYGARNLARAKPLHAFLVAGKKDEIVAYDRQRQSIVAVLKLNGVKEPFADQSFLFAGENAATGGFIHDGGHEYPRGASKMIADFFKSKKKS